MSTTSFSDLPQDTTTDILLRLSVKDLIRSTSVNKTWYSLITNPSFISSQIRKAVSCADDNTVLVIANHVKRNYCSLISIDTSEKIEKFEIPFETWSGGLRLVNEVHGLLLLTDCVNEYTLFLWNPYIKRHKDVGPSCYMNKLWSKHPTIDFECVAGMGYDKVTDDYKIVRIFYFENDVVESPKAEVFSLRKNTWRKIKNASVPRILIQGEFWGGVHVNGCYYWLERLEDNDYVSAANRRIVYFDFENELFGKFNIGHNFLPTMWLQELIQFKDSLALCVIEDCYKVGINQHCHIWLMRQENGVVNWILHSKRPIIVDSYKYNSGFETILGITKNEVLILKVRSRWWEDEDEDEAGDVTIMISCDLKSMICKEHGFRKEMHSKLYTIYPSPAVISLPESLIMFEG